MGMWPYVKNNNLRLLTPKEIRFFIINVIATKRLPKVTEKKLDSLTNRLMRDKISISKKQSMLNKLYALKLLPIEKINRRKHAAKRSKKSTDCR